MAEGYDLALEEWLGVLEELWSAVGKPIEPERLQVYRNALTDVPLGLLEAAVQRVIRENTYSVVPPPGAVWEAVRQELGNPQDMRLAIQRWEDRLWETMIWKRSSISNEIEDEV